MAALAAFDCHDELRANVARYAQNRAVLLEELPAAGIDRLAPSDGAFYVYAAVDHLGPDSQALCRRWLDELGVAVTPGIDFDPAEGHRYARFSYAGATDDMAEAMRRLKGGAGLPDTCTKPCATKPPQPANLRTESAAEEPCATKPPQPANLRTESAAQEPCATKPPQPANLRTESFRRRGGLWRRPSAAAGRWARPPR